ncbi:MAG: hypothetical protein JOZ62_07950 [Acidobacteriaceae bacterium]|nr:hypothetical protein [Acidobacteriaceae bacterium]
MPEPRTTAIAIRTEPARTWAVAFFQAAGGTISRTGAWAADTAQQFGALVSALMGPAVISAYAFALWSLASNLGWTGTFPYNSGPLSNWLIWLAIAIAVNLAAGILRRHARPER